MESLIPYLLLTGLLPGCLGLVGYDCHHDQVKLRSISLIKIEECPDEVVPVISEIVHMQLLQRKRHTVTPYMQCSVKVTRMISHCGMHGRGCRGSSGKL